MFRIALLQFRLALQSKGYLAVMFLMPLMFTAIMHFVSSGEATLKPAPVAVVNNDGRFASEQLLAALEADPGLRVVAAAATDLDQLIADQRVTAALIIPASFEDDLAAGRSPELQLVTAPGSNHHLTAQAAFGRAAAVVAANYRMAAAGAGATADFQATYARVAAERAAVALGVAQAVAFDAAAGAEAETNPRALGITVMFVMMMVLLLSGTILHERQGGTWTRLVAAPLSRGALVGGYVLSFFLVGLFQFAVLVGASALLFKVHWGPLLPLAAMAGATILCASGLGLFLAGVVGSPEQQRNLGMIVLSSTSMLGGVFWPLEAVSESMQKLAYVTPQAWAMAGLQEVMLRGGEWAALLAPLAVLLGVAAVLTTAGVLRVRFE